MGDGWETRRTRRAGHDWVVVRARRPGTIERVEVDTRHFKGNAPGARRGLRRPARPSADGARGARSLPRTTLQPHTATSSTPSSAAAPARYVRLPIFPDGGVSRLRFFGDASRAGARGAGASRALDALPPHEAQRRAARCCGSTAWAARDDAASVRSATRRGLMRGGRDVWEALTPADWLEAFAAHPRIGEQTDATARGWSTAEQAGRRRAPRETLDALAEANRAYEARFGYIFIVCATGRTAERDAAARARAPAAASPTPSSPGRRRAAQDHRSSAGEAGAATTMSPITTHVLDTSRGRPADGVPVASSARPPTPGARSARGDRRRRPREGRCPAGAPRARDATGSPSTRGDYFRARRRRVLPRGAIVFVVRDPAAHHHVPLLLSPFGYSTYRGS